MRSPLIGVDLVGAVSQGPWKGQTYGGSSVIADTSGTILFVGRDRDVDLEVVEVTVGSHLASEGAGLGSD